MAPPLTREAAREQMLELGAALSTAYLLLKPFEPLVLQFQRESRDIESVGRILNPTLFISSERRATEAILKPIYDEALRFIRIYEAQRARGAAALDEIGRGDHGR
ncbi:hypothetical protein QM467_04545 [Rhodoblastus sp. 17X3]|uniref:hypothetical protein n=1 Tax=Rhodoblastus sp. 17X3 TaxID=3047026 RepID=UPI0024B74E48|nr:hypothetical protein [Rhodoblastus sp. 17X3]MDI9847328.1 hypothetical protein [Rhodoblastus sp. 17X3]